MKNPYSRECPYLYRGVIESNQDPENLGRCKVRVPSVHGDLNYTLDTLPWARPIVSSPVNSTKGSYHLPDIGDIVWVFFEGGVKEYPIYFGGTISKNSLQPSLDKIVLYQEENNSLIYDKTGYYEIRIGDNTLKVSSSGISMSGNVNISDNLTVSGDLFIDNISTISAIQEALDNKVVISGDIQEGSLVSATSTGTLECCGLSVDDIATKEDLEGKLDIDGLDLDLLVGLIEITKQNVIDMWNDIDIEGQFSEADLDTIVILQELANQTIIDKWNEVMSA